MNAVNQLMGQVSSKRNYCEFCRIINLSKIRCGHINEKNFKNQHRMLESFGFEFLVACPNCNSKSKVISLGENSPYRVGITKRFLCLNCGMTKEIIPKSNCFNQSIISYSSKWNEGFINIGGSFDWYFGYPLYLQIPCCGQTLWAYNLEHLEYLKNYVQAEIREGHPYYLSVESRLPLWIKSAKNRNAILKAISKLEKKQIRTKKVTSN